MFDNCEDIVCERVGSANNSDDWDVIVCDLPGGGAAPKISEKAASRCEAFGGCGAFE